jgi:glyoxylase-like metal-dependent hydrolase (beta-lactamase superfamily II)
MIAMCVVFAALAAGACNEPRRIPRIEPVLHLWKAPYVGFDGLRIHVFTTGEIRAPAALYQAGGSWFEMQTVAVPAFVIEHPEHGLIVFDCGLSERVAAEPSSYLGAFAGFDLVRAERGQDLPAQMRAAGLDPERVSTVVLSHLHFDHTGSVEAFAGARVVVARAELDAANAADWYQRSLMRPEDYDAVDDWQPVDYVHSGPFATFDGHFDLFDDGSVILVDLAGHTAGTQGAIVMAEAAPVLLTGDAAYLEANWRYVARPAFAHDMDRWWEVAWRIKKLSQLAPATVVLPGHDMAAIERAARKLPGVLSIAATPAAEVDR